MKAIPTVYQGVEYRSRLEAKWSAFFDLIGWQHVYEPFDGDGYLPDFVIHGAAPLLIEIKPAASVAQYRAPIGKVTEGLHGHWDGDILILGVDPLPRLDGDTIADWWPHNAGLLGEWDDTMHPPDWRFGIANWFVCDVCARVSVHSAVARPRMRRQKAWPCGHESDGGIGYIDLRSVHERWAIATNRVKWRAS